MPSRPRIGLALGSGSARGWSHIGVIRALQDAGIEVAVASGTSMGAMVAGVYAAGVLDSFEPWVRKLTWPDMLRFMDVTLPRAGLIEGEKLTKYFRERMSDLDIENLPVPFAAVATDLYSGQEVWLDKGSIMNAIRASMSMPGILTPYPRESAWLVDGGLCNPVPVSLCRHLGAELVIAVNLNSDIMGRRFLTRESRNGNGENGKTRFAAKLSTFLTGGVESRRMRLFQRFIQDSPDRGPSMIQVVAKSVYIMQDRITRQRLATDPPDILVTPHLAHIGLLEFNRAEECIAEGYRAMQLMIPMLEDLLKNHEK